MSRFSLGIDLGTTHTVLAAAALEPGVAAHDVVDVDLPQTVAAAEVAALPQLASTLYLPADGELPADALTLPFSSLLQREGASTTSSSPTGVLGAFALERGSKVPGRVVSSAKSWLCVAGVDRKAAILPWAAAEGVAKVSPLDVQTRILSHVRAAWDHAHPDDPARDLEVTVTVPASFDEVARELTVEAAHAAGLRDVRLLEEPQAAFYAFLRAHSATLTTALADVKLLLVVDVGGGTSDFTLVAVQHHASGPPSLSRVAVGDHLMLGGDNMDVTLARHVERELTGAVGALDAVSFAQLVLSSRLAKETLLRDDAPDEFGVTLAARGSKLLGGARTSVQKRSFVESLLLDGFLPLCRGDELVDKKSRAALSEFGLPYAKDPALSRHLVTFLRRHVEDAAEAGARIVDGLPRPDAILLNGGVFKSPRIRARLTDVFTHWFGAPVPFLDVDHGTLDRAVARGAAYAALVRRGRGLRIAGGSARAYFLGVDTAQGQRAMCVVPQGLVEGERVELERTLRLVVGKPVGFPVWSSTYAEGGHRVKLGDVVDVSASLDPLPALQTVIAAPTEVPVRVQAMLTDVGTLELSLQVQPESLLRHALAFQTRLEGSVEASSSTSKPGQIPRADAVHKRLDDGKDLILGYFGNKSKDVDARRVKDLRRDLEKLFGLRETWTTGLHRELGGALLSGASRRRRSAEHERVFFQMLGWCLRPGFGAPFDDWRIEQLWPLWKEGVQYVAEKPTWSSWFILWRRVVGGLDAARQRELLDYLTPWLLEQGTGKKGTGPTPSGQDEMIRLAAALERVPSTEKIALGDFVTKKLGRGGVTSYWPLGRLGARELLSGSAHDVVPPDVAARWADKILEVDLKAAEGAVFALAQIARVTGDRARDLDAAHRERIAARLDKAQAPARLVQMVRERVELSDDDEAQVLGDVLPVGLHLH